MDLVRAVGGIDSADNQCLKAQTGAKQCPAPAVADSGDKACQTDALVTATATRR